MRKGLYFRKKKYKSSLERQSCGKVESEFKKGKHYRLKINKKPGGFCFVFLNQECLTHGSQHPFRARIISSLQGNKTCNVTRLPVRPLTLMQHILSSPNSTHKIPRLMTMLLVQCPGIYSSPCNCPSQFTILFSNPRLLKFSIFQSFALHPSTNRSQTLPRYKPCLWWNYAVDESGPPHLEQNTRLFMEEMLISSSSITDRLSRGAS